MPANTLLCTHFGQPQWFSVFVVHFVFSGTRNRSPPVACVFRKTSCISEHTAACPLVHSPLSPTAAVHLPHLPHLPHLVAQMNLSENPHQRRLISVVCRCACLRSSLSAVCVTSIWESTFTVAAQPHTGTACATDAGNVSVLRHQLQQGTARQNAHAAVQLTSVAHGAQPWNALRAHTRSDVPTRSPDAQCSCHPRTWRNTSVSSAITDQS
jgi:hypothetical protein